MKSTCPEYQEMLILEAYGELSPKKQRVLEAHLNKCDGCYQEKRQLLNTLGSVKNVMSSPQLTETASANLCRSVTRELNQMDTGRETWARFFPAPKKFIPVLAAASLIIIIVGLFNFSGITPFSSGPEVSIGTAGISMEDQRLIEDYDIIKNLELLEEMESVHKLVQVISEPEPEYPGFGTFLKNNSTTAWRQIQHVDTHA